MSQPMGPQSSTDLLTLLRECEAADAGVLIERRTGELGFDSHTAREDVPASLVLAYSSRRIDALTSTDDDQLVRNVATVTRLNGGTYEVSEATGPLGTAASGRYEASASLNLHTDEQAYNAAGWAVHLGTVDGYRYPVVAFKLHNPYLTPVVDTVAALDISDRITITDLPVNLPPDDVDLVVEGITETISNVAWDISLNCAPYKPWVVGEMADTTSDQNVYAGRLAGDDACALRAAVSSGATTFTVDPNRTRWTTAADDFDPDLQIRLGGEVVAVSGISTTAATYVAAGAASHADNAAVTPALYAGATPDDLICVFAAIRSSGTGTLQTPTGYTRLPVFASTDNVQLFAKVHSGSESAPTVTPSGGSAGDSVSALTFGLRGMPVSLADLADVVVDSATLLNSAAQNIAYPGLYPSLQEGCVVLALGWKQDDWTSVATLSGMTEAADVSTTTGNDQGLVVDYVIQTTPAVINESSFVVTGGAVAISRGALVALAGGYQTFTISARAVNGVTKAHAAGTTLEVEDPFVLAL